MRDISFPKFVFVVILILPVVCQSQTSTPNPNDRLPSLRQIEANARIGAVRPGARDISRQAGKDRRRIKKEKEPEAAVAEQLEPLLKRLNAQLIRLHPDYGCESKHLVSVDADCADRIVGASKHSFRGNAFAPDIHYDEGEIVGDGFFSIVMMTELGDAAFESFGRETGLFKTLFGFKPPTSFAGARNVYETLAGGGLTVDGVTFRDRIAVSEGATFAVRIIAYKTKDLDLFKLRQKDPKAMFQFLSLRSGRSDVTLVAKVVKLSPDGVIHLFWRAIERKPAPAIQFEDYESPRDFRQAKSN